MGDIKGGMKIVLFFVVYLIVVFILFCLIGGPGIQ